MFVHKPQPKKIHSISGKVALTIVEEGNVCINFQFQIITWKNKRNYRIMCPTFGVNEIFDHYHQLVS